MSLKKIRDLQDEIDYLRENVVDELVSWCDDAKAALADGDEAAMSALMSEANGMGGTREVSVLYGTYQGAECHELHGKMYSVVYERDI